jgi:hypothetical protein
VGFIKKSHHAFKPNTQVCAWFGGVVIFFKRYNLFKAQTIPHKSKKYMLLCGFYKKKVTTPSNQRPQTKDPILIIKFRHELLQKFDS